MGQFNSVVFPKPECFYTSETFEGDNKIEFFKSWDYEDKTQTQLVPYLFMKAPEHSNQQQTKNTIIYFHSNAEDIGTSYKFLSHIRDFCSMNVICLEYAGYGIYDQLEPSTEQITLDSENLYNHIQNEHQIAEENIILLGRSLGSGPACFIASKYKPGALILISPFKSFRAILENLIPSWLCWIVKERFENIDRIDKVTCPSFFIHGRSDDVINYCHSKDLFHKIPMNYYADYYFPAQMTHSHFDIIMDIIKPIMNFLKSTRKFNL